MELGSICIVICLSIQFKQRCCDVVITLVGSTEEDGIQLCTAATLTNQKSCYELSSEKQCSANEARFDEPNHNARNVTPLTYKNLLWLVI